MNDLTVTQWAARWSIPARALEELVGCTWFPPNLSTDAPMYSEAGVQSRVRLEAAQKGVRLWRNNVGVLMDADGRPVRYGLANDSKALNQRVKSGDLIGWRPHLVVPADVGKLLAIFLSRECKPVDWKPPRSGEALEHYEAQQRWAQLVQRDGGDAAIVQGVGSL